MLNGSRAARWPCCKHCSSTLICPVWGSGHDSPCLRCDPELRVAVGNDPTDTDEFSSTVQRDELPDDVYLHGHWDGN